ncbi:hypothetical protein KV097_09065 [Mumia sp. zg.B17]|uniref:hypothetical protein n=1 Tax=Mumia sp. zg.B17 TaxID=2855446 RepID=UPI001C6F37D0|nr:hypothetical protein [Mumia sp. zg.B17]MBW9206093.1 hypothetical protein [Mumia sp. zg.B17]
MDILRAGGTFWRIRRRRCPEVGDAAPWMPEFAAGADAPPAASELGRRPIVVTCDGVVMHVEPAPGRRDTERRITEIAAALYALPWAVGTADDPDHRPHGPVPRPSDARWLGHTFNGFGPP